MRDQALARTASHAGLRAGAHLRDAPAPLGLNRVDDLPLADAVAVADLGVVGKVGGLEQGDAGRRPEQEIRPPRGHLASREEHLHQRAGGFDVSEQNRARDLAASDDQLLVDAVFGSRYTTTSSSASAGLVTPIDASSTPITFSLVPSFEP